MHVEVDEEKCTIILRVISLHLDLPSVQSRWVKINLINLFGWWKFCYSFLRNGHFNDTSDKKSGSNELKFYYFHGFEPNIWYVWILSSKHKYAKLCMYVFYFFKKRFWHFTISFDELGKLRSAGHKVQTWVDEEIFQNT